MISLGPISGLSAGWLIAGVAATALPIAAHLARRRSRRIAFPPAAILARNEAMTRRGSRLRERALLAMRVLIVALLALAFDQPTWSERGAPAPGDAMGRDVVILLDRSASMRVVEAGRSRFERARDRALELLDELDGRRDRAGLVFVDARPRTALPELTANFEALRQHVQSAECSMERGDAATALGAAEGLLSLGEDRARAREIVIVTDGQESQWAGVMDSLSLESVSARVMNVSTARDVVNTAIESFVWPERPLVSGEQVRIGVRLRHHGDEEGRALVSLETAQGRRAAAVRLEARSRATAWFDVEAPATDGWAALRASIEGDAFSLDDSLITRAPARGPMRVGIVSQAHESLGVVAIRRAIEAAGAHVEPLPDPNDWSNAPLDLIVIVGGGDEAFPDEESLRSFVEDGVGALVVVDSDAAARRVHDMKWLGVERRGDGARHRGVRVQIDPLLALLGDEDDGASVLRSLLERLELVSMAGLRAVNGANEVVTFDNGDVFVSIVEVGEGRAAVVNADVGAMGSTLIASPVFPLLIDALVSRLTNGRATPQRVVVGERVADVNTAIESTVGAVERREDGWYAGAPGAAWWTDDDGRARSVAIGVEPRESDLRAAEFRTHDGAMTESIEVTTEAPEVALWPWLIGGALAIGLIELCLVAMPRMRREAARGGPS